MMAEAVPCHTPEPVVTGMTGFVANGDTIGRSGGAGGVKTSGVTTNVPEAFTLVLGPVPLIWKSPTSMMLICVIFWPASAKMSTLILSCVGAGIAPALLDEKKFAGKKTRLLPTGTGSPKSPTSFEPFSQLKKPGELPFGFDQGIPAA